MTRDRFVVGRPLGRWQANCYVIGDRSEGVCAVLDPGEGSREQIPALLDELDVDCEAILLTHGHLDHFWGAPDLARSLDVPVYLHPDDRWLWDDPAAGFGTVPDGMLEKMFGLVWQPADDHLRDVKDGQVMDVAGVDYTVRHNPGHTPGHVTYLADGLVDAEISFPLMDPQDSGAAPASAGSEGTPTRGVPPASAGSEGTPPVLFSGDLIFAGSVGRTDFPRGSMDDLLRSLAETVLPLEDDTVILSGHGPDTTVGRERDANPYLGRARRQATDRG